MPWTNVTYMEEINQFVILARSGRFTVTELCEQFGISRKTGYKHLERYAALGLAGLQPRSHRPHHSPQRTDEAIEALILAERRLHRTWGPKKLQAVLARKHAIEQPPACSTIAEILRRHGQSVRRRRRPGAFVAGNDGLTVPTQPNHVWTVDFKGWFTLGNRERCDPLTVCDRYSHYLLACTARPNQQFKSTLQAFRALMRHHGLPEIIRCDLGSPFASNGLGRLSSLSLWWIEQGIEVEFMRPASPQENGSHERMHRDLKAEAIQPVNDNDNCPSDDSHSSPSIADDTHIANGDTVALGRGAGERSSLPVYRGNDGYHARLALRGGGAQRAPGMEVWRKGAGTSALRGAGSAPFLHLRTDERRTGLRATERVSPVNRWVWFWPPRRRRRGSCGR